MEIKFKRPVQFIGRNGCFKAIGLNLIVDTRSSVVSITPITSKNAIGNCLIEIPIEEWHRLQAIKVKGA